MTAALSVVLMLLTTVIPFLTYFIPILTGVLVYFVFVIINQKWAFGVFSATSVIALLLLTDKEAALTYALFFGWYPLVKEAFEHLPKALSWLFKIVAFNAAIILVGILTVLVFGGSPDDYSGFGKFTIPILLLMGNVVFVLYDISFSKNLKRLKTLSLKFIKKLK